MMCCSITSSAEQQLAADKLNVGGPGRAPASISLGGPVNCGSLPDLLSVNIEPPLLSPLDVNDSVTASLPSYDMAVADSNRRTQQLQQLATVMSSEPAVLTDSCAKTNLLSGGNTIMLVPQVDFHTIVF